MANSKQIKFKDTTYMQDNLSGWVFKSKNSCDKTENTRLEKFRKNLIFYVDCMYDKDKVKFVQIIEKSGMPDCCWLHKEEWCKEIGNIAKISGNRCSDLYVFLLDLVSLGGWTQYTQEQSADKALVFTKVEEEELMFPDMSDEQLYEDVYSFCSQHAVLGEARKESLARWIETREWANHGTATDVLEKDELFASDKSTLAYKFDVPPLGWEEELKNEVFPKKDRKPRIIVVGPTPEYILGSYVNSECVRRLITAPFQITNTEKSVPWRDIVFEQIQSNKFLMPIDQSAFDQHQRKSAVLAARDFLVDTLVSSTGETELNKLKAKRRETITSKGVELGEWKHGLLSGKWYTSIVGSLLNAYEIFRVVDRNWDLLEIPTLHQGDDAQIALKEEKTIYSIFNNADVFNIPFNPSKNFVDIGRTDYLHNMCSGYLGSPKVGKDPIVKKNIVWKYPARAFTSILDGDAEAKKEGTTSQTQGMWVIKNTDRTFAALTRLANFERRVIEKLNTHMELRKEELEYQMTPTTFGGLGCFDLGHTTQLVAATTVPKNKFSFVSEPLGYSVALEKTQEQYSMNLKEQALQLIESTLKFNKLPDKERVVVKKGFYNLRKVAYKVKLTFLDAQITRDGYTGEFSLEPQTSVDPYWKALGAAVASESTENWDTLSKKTYAMLRRAGKYVQSMWVKGEIKISVQYTRTVNKENLQKYNHKFNVLLYSYLMGHRGSDVTPGKLRSIMYELERKCFEFVNSQNELYECT